MQHLLGVQSGGLQGNPEAQDRKAAINEAGMAECGDVGEWLGVDSGKRTQVTASFVNLQKCLLLLNPSVRDLPDFGGQHFHRALRTLPSHRLRGR